MLKEQEKGQDDEGRADVRHNQIKQPGVPDICLFMFRYDKEIRGQRHQFPDDQKEEPVVGKYDEGHREKKSVEERSQRAHRHPAVEMPQIAHAINGRGTPGQGYRQDEKRCKGIEPDRTGQQRNRRADREPHRFGGREAEQAQCNP